MKALVFVPRSPWPTRSGMDVRASGLVELLRRRYRGVTLASLYPPEVALPAGVTSTSRFDATLGRSVYRRSTWISPQFARGAWLRPQAMEDLHAWFASLGEREVPDLVVIHQSRFAPLLPDVARRNGTRAVLDAPEPQSANDVLWGRVTDLIGDFPVDIAAIPGPIVDRLPSCDAEVVSSDIDPSELDAFKQFDRVLLASRSETACIDGLIGEDRARWVPGVVAPHSTRPKTYDGPAVFLMAANPHNVAGFVWFVRRVLPLVKAVAPDFRLRVVGEGARCVRPLEDDAIDLVGIVPDLSEIYADARLAICPVFSGTGQPVKLLEALANRTPFVAVSASARRAGLVEGMGGLIAEDAESFAESTIALWNDQRLAQRLGSAGAAWARGTDRRSQMERALDGL